MEKMSELPLAPVGAVMDMVTGRLILITLPGVTIAFHSGKLLHFFK